MLSSPRSAELIRSGRLCLLTENRGAQKGAFVRESVKENLCRLRRPGKLPVSSGRPFRPCTISKELRTTDLPIAAKPAAVPLSLVPDPEGTPAACALLVGGEHGLDILGEL